jgi:transposase
VATDALGRRNGPRRLRRIEEKRQIVEETLQPGASVAMVAQAHGVNANLVFGWRKLYQKGNRIR